MTFPYTLLETSFGMSIGFYIYPSIRSADHGTNRNDDNVDQWVLDVISRSRICQVSEIVTDARLVFLGHFDLHLLWRPLSLILFHMRLPW